MDKTFDGCSANIPEDYTLDSAVSDTIDWCSESFWYSKDTYTVELDDREVEFRLCVSATDYAAMCGDSELDGQVAVDIELVPVPSAFDKSKLESIAESSGVDVDEVTLSDIRGYGCYIRLAGETLEGLDDKTKMQSDELLDKVRTASYFFDAFGRIMIGFALDRRQNLIGNTGWDFLEDYVKDDHRTIITRALERLEK